MTDEIELLREFRAEVPSPDDETRQRIYAYATRPESRRFRTQLFARATRRSRLSAPTGVRRDRAPRRRVVAVFSLAVIATAIAATATRGGASAPMSAVQRAEGVDSVVSQVQNSFGDSRIASASVLGSTLSVKLTTSNQPSFVSATFEAQVLAHAVANWMSVNGQESIAAVRYVDASGAPLVGTALYGDPMSSSPSVAPLSSGACETGAQAAQAADTSLNAVSVRTLPWLNGTCLFDFESSNPAAFADSAPDTVGKLVDALGDPNDRPYLIEVDDANGTPQFVDSWVPGFGGTTWIEPSLSHAFVLGGSSVSGSSAVGP